jgi:hypothetical protein
MSYSQEYTGVGPGPACAYNSLKSYNQTNFNVLPPTPTTDNIPVVVPVYGSVGYGTLTHGHKVPSCGSYFPMSIAYPTKGACKRFQTSLCG